jgi:hypothetical protein
MAEDLELKKVQEEFAKGVAEMTETIRQATAAAAPKPAAAPAVPAVDLSAEGLDRMAKEQGVGKVMQAVGQHVLLPMQEQAYDLAIKANRRLVEKDPELGKWAKKHKAAVDAAIKADPRRAAEDGVDGIVRSLRDGDSEFQNERVEAEVQRRLAEEKAKAPEPVPGPYLTPAPRVPVDRPAPVSAPSASPATAPTTLSAEIASIPVSDEEVAEFRRLVPGGTKEDIQIHRHARLQAQKDMVQYNRQGGVPICSLEEIGQAPRP